MALCEHFLDPGSCTDCRPRAAAPPPPDYGPWFEASYTGVCSGCDHMIRPGDQARHDGYDGYLCAACGDTGPGLTTVTVSGGLL